MEDQRSGGSWWDALRRKARSEGRRIGGQGRKALLRLRLGQHWREAEGERLSRRVYPSYETYLAHQRVKLDAHRDSSIARYDRNFFAALSERLSRAPLSLRGCSVLCLAARQGTEVRAFIGQGAFAVGIDLNPGRENRYVVTGDFHALQFADGTVDVVFTNSLDHAFDLPRVLAEVHRVLVPDGVLLAEVGRGSGAGVTPGFYEALAWHSVDDLLPKLLAGGFTLEHRAPFEAPWPGEQLILRKAP
ncbi:MAG TPA: class I SAM-dependent methyltransferase [Longimicrobiaceae bacterium]|nr:class I SAM-dependent methyltransferase [Longimicrobiaceae bacterium]